MAASPLTAKIGELVDHLRNHSDREISVADVASLTEVLISSMQRFFRSLDESIFKEFQTLASYINTAREEIAQLGPSDLASERIPRAGKELDAIVFATETATNTIMEAAEEMMAADPTDPQAYQTTVNDAVMRIFEACSFQDITGQRISKVVETLSHIEQRITDLGEVWGIDAQGNTRRREPEPKTPPDYDDVKALTNGPALEGEGIDQDEVDSLLAASDPDGAAMEPSSNGPALPDEGTDQEAIDRLFDGPDESVPKIDEPETDAPELNNESASNPGDSAAASHDSAMENGAASDKNGANTAGASVDQDAIDALFDAPEDGPDAAEEVSSSVEAKNSDDDAEVAPDSEPDSGPDSGLDEMPPADAITTQEEIDALFGNNG